MILITGGAGYIGSHTLIELHNAGYDFVVYDNLSNSSKESISRVEKIILKSITFIQGDIRDKKALEEVFEKYEIDSVIHFAGLKSINESVSKPVEYYDNNINGTLILLELMKKYDCKNLVFSSSAVVYGDPERIPVDENCSIGEITNPYGRTKYFIEEMLKDVYKSDSSFKIVILRYFNPVGAHESGLIGEDPTDIPNNLMPFIFQVAVGKREYLNVFGSDYDTPDGTGVRDFIHIVDLANGHVKAIEYLKNSSQYFNPLIVNLGTGEGYSVLDMLKAFEKVNEIKIPYKLVDRRDGDIGTCYADVSLSKDILNWEANKTLEDMCKDSWNWQSKNPNGYKQKK